MNRTKLVLGTLALLLGGVGQAKGGVIFYTDQGVFDAQGSILQNSNFNDFGTGFSFPSNPFTRGDVTYISEQNLIFGTATPYAPVQNMIGNNYWTPFSGTIANGYNMFGFDTGVLTDNGTSSLVDVTIVTNDGSYSFNGLSIPKANTGEVFLGFITTTAGEQFTNFTLATENGPGWAPGMTNVELGSAGPDAATPEPSTLTLLGIGSAGLVSYGWRRRRRTA